MNSVAVDCRGMPEPSWLQKAAAFAVKAMDAAGAESWDLSLVFCGEEFMAGLNSEYRGKDGPTDVLSFTLGEWLEGENGRRYIAGDVVICTGVMSRNAACFGVSENEELKRLIVHGVLHLAGMDHETNGREEPMLSRQEAILSALPEDTIF